VAPTDNTESFSPADVELLAISPEDVDEIWWLASSQLALALSWTRKATLDSIHERLVDGGAQLWMAFLPQTDRILCSCVTDLIKWESGHITCRVLLVGGGRIELWRHLMRHLEAYAISEGAEAMEVIGRKGWERIFAREGYTHAETTITKELV